MKESEYASEKVSRGSSDVHSCRSRATHGVRPRGPRHFSSGCTRTGLGVRKSQRSVGNRSQPANFSQRIATAALLDSPSPAIETNSWSRREERRKRSCYNRASSRSTHTRFHCTPTRARLARKYWVTQKTMLFHPRLQLRRIIALAFGN